MSKENELPQQTENLKWQKDEPTPLVDSVLYGQLENDILILLCDNQQRNIEVLARLLIALDDADEDDRGVIIERAMGLAYARTNDFRANLKSFVESIRAEIPQA